MICGLLRVSAITLGATLTLACQAAPSDTPAPASTPPTSQPAAPSGSEAPASDPAAEKEEEGHEHTAPHGGSLVEFGEEFAHLELVLDASTGTLTAYALDGEAEEPVRVAAATIDMKIVPDGATAPQAISLLAVENALTGERVGDTSQFRAIVPALKGQSRFRGTIADIRLRGQRFTDVEFEFPAGH
jgi:hypothetical protein